MGAAKSSVFLTPREIAAWSRPAAWSIPTATSDTSKIIARPPALQRGAVWRAPQDEALWDSMLRGFPIGSFLLADFDEGRMCKDLKFQEPGVTEPDVTHHLLDGQQRSNAIALGFLNPWSMNSPSAALWIDLQKPEPNDEREFVLRELTRSHPWGYPLSGDAPRLSAEMIRKAVTAYKKASPSLVNESGGQIPLTLAWPWNANAPVPLCFFLESVDCGDNVSTFLLERLSTLPFWEREVSTSDCTPEGDTWQQRVTRILKATSGSDCDYLERVIRAAKRVLGKDEDTSYKIAALFVPSFTAVPTGDIPDEKDPDGNVVQKDPIETLFIRINRGGTRLDGEELNYSILKSIWPKAERFIQDMDVRFASPSRIVTLASRLVLSELAVYEEGPPALPNVARFRRLIHGLDRDCKNFQSKLLSFFRNGTAGKVFRAFRAILTSNELCNLPSSVAAELSPNVMFLLLRWVQRMLKEGYEPKEKLNKVKTLRLVGAITALSWFSAEDSNTGGGKYSLHALWGALQEASGNGLVSFFSRRQFARSFKLTKGKFGLLPLVPPDVLENAIRANVLGRGFGFPNSESWRNWDWETLTTRNLGERRFGKKLKPWYRKSFKKLWQRGDQSDEEDTVIENDGDLENYYKQAWRLFVLKLWDEKALLLFAQREWLGSWLVKANPNGAELAEEADRPWDYDHIHPYAFIKVTKKVPWKIKDWHGSIGNLRAWPLSENRSDGDSPPREKLKFSGGHEDEGLMQFCIESEEKLHEASFVDAKNLVDWNLSTPEDEAFKDEAFGEEARKYLGNPDEFGEQRKHLVRAIVGRWLSLYRHWYETLRIGDLCP